MVGTPNPISESHSISSMWSVKNFPKGRVLSMTGFGRHWLVFVVCQTSVRIGSMLMRINNTETCNLETSIFSERVDMGRKFRGAYRLMLRVRTLKKGRTMSRILIFALRCVAAWARRRLQNDLTLFCLYTTDCLFSLK